MAGVIAFNPTAIVFDDVIHDNFRSKLTAPLLAMLLHQLGDQLDSRLTEILHPGWTNPVQEIINHLMENCHVSEL